MQLKEHQIAGWNEACTELHAEARDAFLLWINSGKPRQGATFELMSKSRARFKHALRQCKDASSHHTADSIAKKLLKCDSRGFWKEVKKLNNKDKDVPLPETIDGQTGIQPILDMWKAHYKTLLNSNQANHTHASTDYSSSTIFKRFSPGHVENAVIDLKSGKSPGPDDISAEHLKFAHKSISVILSLLFNSMIIHGYLPQEFMSTTIIPIVKDKKGDLSNCDNYRPVALTSVFSKVFELLILIRYSDQFRTSSNQFGFKASHGTEECIFVLKHVIQYYKSNSSPVYLCFLDLSKAFDRVNHNILFNKLVKRGIHPLIVRLLQIWYATQTFCVKWGTSLSTPFRVTNGTRQGSILSPSLFNVYIDDLSNELMTMSVGCYINDKCFNHLIYADDTVLIAPSPNALQKLLNVCNEFVNCNDLVFNVKKTKCMMIASDVIKDLDFPNVYLNGNVITIVQKEKYLGFYITNDCCDDSSIVAAMRGLYSRGNMLRRNFKQCNDNVKIRLFQSYCSSLYCGSLWYQYNHNCIKKLKVCHNNVFRYFFKVDRRESISQHFANFNMPNFNVIRRKLVFSLYKRVFSSQNQLIQTIVSSVFFMNSKLFKCWHSILFS